MKKIISICFIILIIAFGKTLYAMDDFDPKTPKLIIEELQEVPTVGAGETLSLTLKIQNISNYSASSIRITPSFENTPLVYERPVSVSLENSIRKKKDVGVSFAFKVKETAKIGIYTIPFKLQYDNIYDETFISEQTVYFKVIKEKSPALLTINNISSSIESITANSQFVLSFDLNNIGDLEAKNLQVSLSGLNKDEFITLDSEDMYYVGTLLGNETKHLSFNLITSNDISTGTHSLTIDTSYINSDGENVSTSKTIYLTNIIGNKKEEEKEDKPDTEDISTPKVIISSYSTDPSSIKAGDSIKFYFTFTNTHSAKRIKNMKLTVDSTEGAFMIAKGSNTFYVESMKPKTSITKSIELNVKQDLTSKSYPINISFDYEDTKGNNYSSHEVINLPVTEYSKLVINGIYVGEAYVSGNTNLSFDYINMGKATVSNLTASVEGDYESVQSINYIGNLNSGTSDYYDIEVRPTKDGENNGTLILSFEDSSGKIIEVKKEFQGYGMEQFIQDDYSDSIPYEPYFPEKQDEVFHLSGWAIAGIGLATFVLSFIITKMIATKILLKKWEDEI